MVWPLLGLPSMAFGIWLLCLFIVFLPYFLFPSPAMCIFKCLWFQKLNYELQNLLSTFWRTDRRHVCSSKERACVLLWSSVHCILQDFLSFLIYSLFIVLINRITRALTKAFDVWSIYEIIVNCIRYCVLLMKPYFQEIYNDPQCVSRVSLGKVT